MPNWCTNQYSFIGPAEEIQKFATYVYICADSAKDPDDRGWLYLIVKAMGYKPRRVECRGWISWIDDIPVIDDKEEEITFSIETQTAWGPLHETWDLLLEKHFPNIRYLYYSEEPGFEIYETNDELKEFFDFDYIVSVYLDKAPKEIANKYAPLNRSDNQWTLYDLKNTLEKILNKSGDIEDLIAEAHKESTSKNEFDYFVNFHRVVLASEPRVTRFSKIVNW